MENQTVTQWFDSDCVCSIWQHNSLTIDSWHIYCFSLFRLKNWDTTRWDKWPFAQIRHRDNWRRALKEVMTLNIGVCLTLIYILNVWTTDLVTQIFTGICRYVLLTYQYANIVTFWHNDKLAQIRIDIRFQNLTAYFYTV